MNLILDYSLTERYRSLSQKVRVMTEAWVGANAYCPSCGQPHIAKYPNNSPVADFFCDGCDEDYELKSKADHFGEQVVDGAYKTMIARLREARNPSLFLLAYEASSWRVADFSVVPKYFFTPDLILPRPPLMPSAQRANWQGCNINLKRVPAAGRIFIVRNGRKLDAKNVLSQWRQTSFLKKERDLAAKGWLVDMMSCLDGLGKSEFTLAEAYGLESSLAALHPQNHHLKDKIRQQLQLLRDRGYLRFVGRGRYSLVNF